MNDDFQGYANVLFSIDAGAFTDAQMDALRSLNVAWKVLNQRTVNLVPRWYIDIIGPKMQLVQIRNALVAMGRNPTVIAVFTPTDQDVLDGQGNVIGQTMVMALTQANKAEYLNVAPDVSPGVRPTSFIDFHRWAGWPDKALP